MKKRMHYKKVDAGTDVLTAARQRMATAFDLYDDVVIGFSGGKDSTVCTLLALDEARKRGRLPLTILHFDEEVMPPTTEEYVRRIAKNPDIDLKWFCLPIKHRNACSRQEPYWNPWDPAKRDKWVRNLPPEAIWVDRWDGPVDCSLGEMTNHYVKENSLKRGRSAIQIVGIRGQESLRRMQVVLKRQRLNWISTPSSFEHLGYPIYDWTVDDIWQFMRDGGYDYNRHYDYLERSGMGWMQQRVCPPFGEEPLQDLYTYSILYPKLWDKVVERVDGAATAARYARTFLYGFGQDDPNRDAPFMARIDKYLARWPNDTRKELRHRIQTDMARYYGQTGRKTIDHKDQKYFIMLAKRGDLKGRRANTLTRLIQEDKAPI